MRKLYKALCAVVLWSYDRGTWQYDLMCVAILLFIFATPSSLFIERRKPIPQPMMGVTERGAFEYVSAQELAQVAPSPTLQEMLEAVETHKHGRPVKLKHVEIVKGADDLIIGYRVWVD